MREGFFLNEDQFGFFSKLIRDIDLILFYRNLWKICMGLNFFQLLIMTGYVIIWKLNSEDYLEKFEVSHDYISKSW